MTAEHYLKEKELLSRAMNGQDRLMEAVKDITEVFAKHNIHLMPGVALDVAVFALETIQLDQINLRDRRL